MGLVTLSFINKHTHTHTHRSTEFKLIWKMCWFIRGGKRKSKQSHLVLAIPKIPRLVFPCLQMSRLEAFEEGTGIILWAFSQLRWTESDTGILRKGFFLLYDFACSILTAVASKKKTYFSHYIFWFHQMNWVSLALFLFKKIHKTRQLNLTQI